MKRIKQGDVYFYWEFSKSKVDGPVYKIRKRTNRMTDFDKRYMKNDQAHKTRKAAIYQAEETKELLKRTVVRRA